MSIEPEPRVLDHVQVTRYVTAFREGGSLPGLMEADDLGTYVVKFHGAGQGRKVLVAEVVCAELARAMGFAVPRLVTAGLDVALAAAEPDPEIQELLRASGGLNLGVDYLPGSLDYDPRAFPADSGFAARLLWFDAFTQNVDRSWRNPNMLWWHGNAYLIDHGAALTFHHNWPSADAGAARPYAANEHVLLPAVAEVSELDSADAELSAVVHEGLLRDVLAAVPDEWLEDEPGFASADELRAAYVSRLGARLDARPQWLPPLRESVRTAVPHHERTPAKRALPSWLAEGGSAS
ncbi:HipA family kinase [Amycolatopsis minnesotensis]|uniref:HipA family kinase n=1 Tax=Amycolatopsis minnesotensis TaxID=337894 RepID=UPI0031E3AC9F